MLSKYLETLTTKQFRTSRHYHDQDTDAPRKESYKDQIQRSLDVDEYKYFLPKLKELFTKMNGGSFARRVVIDFNDKQKIVFLMGPIHKIASMSTGNKKKKNPKEESIKSCMNLDFGIESFKVGSSIGQGTFIAWLVKNNDLEEICHPVARVLFKPYISGAETENPMKSMFDLHMELKNKKISKEEFNKYNIIWVADKVYGEAPDEFRNKAIKFVNKFQDLEGDPLTVHQMPHGVYRDVLPDSMHRLAADKEKMIDMFSKMSEKEQMRWVKTRPDNIQFIKNPSIEMQEYVAHKDVSLLKYVKNVNRRVADEAITANIFAIQYIDNPTHSQVETALHQNPGVVFSRTVQNITPDLALAAIKKYISNLSRSHDYEYAVSRARHNIGQLWTKQRKKELLTDEIKKLVNWRDDEESV